EDEFTQAMRRWLRDCDRLGMTQRQKADELLWRNALARLRRNASMRAQRRPQDYHAIVRATAAEEAQGLAIFDDGLAKAFLDGVAVLGVSDILYPDALATCLAYWRRHDTADTITDDMIAALA